TFTTVDDSPLSATGQWPLPSSTSVPATTTVRATYSKPVVAGSVEVTVRDALGDVVPGTTAYDAAIRTVTFTPSSPLAGFVEHTATVRGTDSLGQPVTAGGSWTFRTAKPAAAPGVCPCSLFDDDLQPTVLEDSDRSAVTLGVRFSPTADGKATAVRFYKGPGNTGSHTGTLWRADGTLLATGTFADESTAGWQTLVLPAPVQLTRNVEYVAAYRTSVGRYSVTPNGFALADLSRGPLRVSSTSGAYTYGSGFPSASSASNYLIDVVFERDPAPLTVVDRSPADGATGVRRGSTVKVELFTPVADGYDLSLTTSAGAVPGSTALSEDRLTVMFQPTDLMPEGAEVTATLSGVRSQEGVILPTQTWRFTTRSGTPLPEQTLFGPQVPAVPAVDDSAPVEVGVEVRPTKAGEITGIRFFKGSGNTGSHRGSLWSASGELLARVTFVGETASGWQTAMLDSPVAVTPGISYVASYLAPKGHYSATSGFFSNAWTSGDVTAPAGANGRYLYGADGGFPSYSWGDTNYFVDVVFEKAPSAPVVTGRSPAPDATGVSTDAAPRITFADPVATDGWTMTVTHGGTAVPGSAALSADRTRLTFTPDAPLPSSTQYAVEVAGVRSLDELALSTTTWSFTTGVPSAPTVSLLDGETPAGHSTDSDPLELGMAFVPAVAGEVTGVRFWKGPGNTGVHTGSLWSIDGTRLATMTVTDETDSGWQTAPFDAPIPVTPGRTYVVSYYSPTGRFSYTGGFFATAWSEGPLTAPAGDNGRYRYGSGGAFPTGSWNSTSYFVDVLFRAAP
ncbi:MAG: DUF4082 domain-containing protein, partial [Nocardioides sp.]